MSWGVLRMAPMKFNARQLAIELAIIASYIGLVEIVVTAPVPVDYFGWVFLTTALSGLVGAFVGGLCHRYWFGALIGAIAWLTVAITLIAVGLL